MSFEQVPVFNSTTGFEHTSHKPNATVLLKLKDWKPYPLIKRGKNAFELLKLKCQKISTILCGLD